MTKRLIQGFLLIMSVWLSAAQAQGTFTITDMRGKTVTVPKKLERIATISDGFVEGVLTHLGEVKKVTAIGSWSMKRDYKYNFVTKTGEKYAYTKGWNTMKFLNPWLNDLPCFNSPQGNILNFEALAKSKPQLVIMRVGDCTVRAANPEALQKTIKTIEGMGFPLVVIKGPSTFPNGDLTTIRKEMEVIGSLFGKQKKAVALADYLYKTVAMIRKRTQGVPEAKKTKVLLLGLSPKVRKQGGTGNVWGVDTPESYIVEKVANAKSAFRGKGVGQVVNVEQIYSLSPDVIVLPTWWGYHPPREILEGADFAILSEIPAIKNKRVVSMPWTPMNCTRRVEYPLDMLIIAKAAYPERFKDIKVHEFALKFYQDVYGVDVSTAKKLRSTQWLDWTVEHDF